MAGYASITNRTNASSLIPEDVAKEILQGAINKSMALQLFRHRTMTRAQQRMPVLSALPSAYFVSGATLNDRDTSLKQTTGTAWGNKYLNAEELAVIVPVPQAVLDDVDYDLWTEIKPLVEEAVGIALDDAILFGTNKPATWDAAIVTAANSAGNLLVNAGAVDYLDDVNTLMGFVESDGYEVNGFVARPQVKAKLRGMRSTTREFIYLPEETAAKDGGPVATLFGEPLRFCRSGLTGFATGASGYSLITGDWQQGIIGIRQDMEWKVLDQAIIQDAAGVIQYNLAQQDMVALRVTARFGWATPNPINRQATVEANRYPFAVLQQKASTGGEA